MLVQSVLSSVSICLSFSVVLSSKWWFLTVKLHFCRRQNTLLWQENLSCALIILLQRPLAWWVDIAVSLTNSLVQLLLDPGGDFATLRFLLTIGLISYYILWMNFLDPTLRSKKVWGLFLYYCRYNFKIDCLTHRFLCRLYEPLSHFYVFSLEAIISHLCIWLEISFQENELSLTWSPYRNLISVYFPVAF